MVPAQQQQQPGSSSSGLRYITKTKEVTAHKHTAPELDLYSRVDSSGAVKFVVAFSEMLQLSHKMLSLSLSLVSHLYLRSMVYTAFCRHSTISSDSLTSLETPAFGGAIA